MLRCKCRGQRHPKAAPSTTATHCFAANACSLPTFLFIHCTSPQQCALQLEISPERGVRDEVDSAAVDAEAAKKQAAREATMRQAAASMLFIDLMFWKSAAVCDEVRNEYWLQVRRRPGAAGGAVSEYLICE